MHNYLLSDFIARLNITKANHFKSIIVKPANLIYKLLIIFEDLGLIRGYLLEKDGIEILMKYHAGRSVFSKLIVVSKPGKRIYVNLTELYIFKDRHFGDLLILSTDEGYMLDIDCIKKKKGGEIILRIKL